MTRWNGERPRPDYRYQDWSSKVTKAAIERSHMTDPDPTPWHLWGRDYETGHITEEIEDFATFAEAVAGIPAFLARNNFVPQKEASA